MMSDFKPKFHTLKDYCMCCCCPPLPTRIAAKCSLMPPEPTYSIGDLKSTRGEDSTQESPRFLQFVSDEDWPLSRAQLDKIDAFTTRSSRGNDLACVYVPARPTAKFTILFSHGNACDVGQMTGLFVRLASLVNCNIFGYGPLHCDAFV